MDFPTGFYQIQQVIADHLPQLRPAQQRGLALWVWGTVVAHSACQNAVLSALVTWNHHLGVVREYLREWLYDGKDKAAPCQTQVEVRACFPRLLSWLISLWVSSEGVSSERAGSERAGSERAGLERAGLERAGSGIALAIDACSHQDRVTALVISVLYQGCAIPVAWHILPGNQKGSWMEPLLELLECLAPALSATREVLVMVDRGLWSRRLWQGIRRNGWHPVMRVQNDIHFRPLGQGYCRAARLVREGEAWVGEGHAFSDSHGALAATLTVLWAQGQQEPWLVLSDVPAKEMGVCWYGLRMWIELGFRALKGFGWGWNKTRRQDPQRVARHWLVMAVATLWVMACGTRVEEAMGVDKPAHQLRQPLNVRGVTPHTLSVFRLGLEALAQQFIRGRVWTRLWLHPTPWPLPSPSIIVTYHSPP